MGHDRSLLKEGWVRMRYAPRGLRLRAQEFQMGLPRRSGGTFDFSLLPALLGVREPICLDIGACDGLQSRAILEAIPAAKLHCFEPDPRNLRMLRRILEGTPAKIHEMVLSDADAPVVFWRSGGAPAGRAAEIPEGYSGSGSLARPKLHKSLVPWVTFDDSMSVSGLTLDTWCAMNDVTNIDFIWMDVQGAEHRVFSGGARILQHTRFIHTEYCNLPLYDGQRPLVDLVKQLGDWEVLWRSNSDALLRNRRLVSLTSAPG